ncbi:hypothetical protein [Aureliella helgolandensis]|uniref:Uncharacterized protein n=1 Tax=Aureliella helgolandensis TaxID=2527968 RepID=A0A518GEF1_9BACT|nr:hypothetical protein [Aureliella helgolandensis]QDV26981.1 hypothetical protein Q31a_53610 [Aureliella helgolandensis]
MNRLKMLVLAIATLAVPRLHGDESEKQPSFSVGDRAPSSAVARFVTGPWADPQPRVACPVLLNRKSPKVAVYTRAVTPAVVELLKALDAVVAEQDALKWSFVLVSHENDPRPTDEEFNAQLKELELLASKQSLRSLSLGVLERAPVPAQVVRRKLKLGFLEQGETIVALIAPPESSKRSFAELHYVHRFHADDISANKLDEVVVDLRNACSKTLQNDADAVGDSP